MVKYEYCLKKHQFNATTEDALAALNKMGAEGWRFVHDNNGYALFVREMAEVVKEAPAPLPTPPKAEVAPPAVIKYQVSTPIPVTKHGNH